MPGEPAAAIFGRPSAYPFLRAVAEQYACRVLAPCMVEKWRERIEARTQGDVSKMDTPAAPQVPAGAPGSTRFTKHCHTSSRPTASGHTAAPPIPAMNSRRRISMPLS
jgi:hypothetical protein